MIVSLMGAGLKLENVPAGEGGSRPAVFSALRAADPGMGSRLVDARKGCGGVASD